MVDTDCYIKLWFNGCTECDVMCAPDQQFYSVTAKQWVHAYQLTRGDYLLAEGNARVWLTDIELVKKPMRMYTINVKHNNTFVVSRHKLLAHNMAIACDIPAEIIGSVVASVASIVGIAVEGGSIVIAGALAGPVGVVAAAGLGYVAGSLLVDTCKIGGSFARYQTKSCAEKIDETIASMKQDVAAVELCDVEKGGAQGDTILAKGLSPAVKAILDMQGAGDVYTGYAPGPDDDKDFFKNLEKKADKRCRLPGGGKKYYRDSRTSLWWSRDKAQHGGVHYKVYIERKTGLEWFLDVCEKTGKVMNKHKGPVGKFISFKDLIPF